MRTRLLAVTSVASLLLIAAACGDDSDDDSAMIDNVSSGEQSEGSEGSDDSEGGGQTEAGEPIDATASGEVIATTEGSYEATPNDSTLIPFTIEITRLERNGDLVELGMTLTNDHDAVEFAPYSAFATTGQPGWDLSAVRLIDQDSQRAYLPILDSEDVCLCTGQLDGDIPPGESVQLNATFGGMSGDTSAVDIHVPQTTPMNGVPISG